MLPSHLLSETVRLTHGSQVLILNSAANPFVQVAAKQPGIGPIMLAEDNVAALQSFQSALEREQGIHHTPFHKYISVQPPAAIDVAIMDLLYQPGNAWMDYGLRVAVYALKPGGSLYVVGAKDRGVLSIAKRMQAYFGNIETLAIGKGQRVVRSLKEARQQHDAMLPDDTSPLVPAGFASGKLDEGTQLLLEALEVHTTDAALDIGCGSGFIGIHIARLARKGSVTMVDASLAAVDAAQQSVEQSGLQNIVVLPSNGAQAVLAQRFDLVVTNPPFHLGGIQTTQLAERFIREAAQVLRLRGRFYLVANRFLKYEPAMRACFKLVEEVSGNTRYKVLRASQS
jgi:16S rRNA (guanine1207-N2)-methyltransferase